MPDHADDTPLSREAIAARLSQYAEGALPEDEAAQVARAVSKDPALAQELDALHKTLAALRATPRPTPPTDMVARVRARLEEDAARARLATAPASPAAHPSEPEVPPARFWRRGAEIALGLCAAAAVVVGVTFSAQQPGADGPQTAGIAGASDLVVSEFSAPALSAAEIAQLATEAGLHPEQLGDRQAFVGEQRAAQRFVVALRTAALRRGGEVSGLLPNAERVAIVVHR